MIKSMETLDILGYVGGIFFILCLFPQLYILLKTKNSKDVSITMYILLLCGNLSWFIYGVLTMELKILITNTLTVFLTLLIIILAIYYKNMNGK